MSAVAQAIETLEAAINKLEDAAISLEDSMAGRQRDMFTAPAKPAVAINGSSVKGAVIAQRLDQAIMKVEQLLSEG